DPRPHQEVRGARSRRPRPPQPRRQSRKRASPRRAAPELAARAGARDRARRGRGWLPRREARRMSELLDFTAAQAAERIRAGDISADELFEAYRERAAAEDLNA